MKFTAGDSILFRKGDEEHAGVIVEGYTSHISIEIAGHTVEVQGTEDNPAYLISISGTQRTIRHENELKPSE